MRGFVVFCIAEETLTERIYYTENTNLSSLTDISHVFRVSYKDTLLGHTCLLANTNKTASLSSSSANILMSSSLASFTRSLSLLSTTKIRPRSKQRVGISTHRILLPGDTCCWRSELSFERIMQNTPEKTQFMLLQSHV